MRTEESFWSSPCAVTTQLHLVHRKRGKNLIGACVPHTGLTGVWSEWKYWVVSQETVVELVMCKCLWALSKKTPINQPKQQKKQPSPPNIWPAAKLYGFDSIYTH